MMLQPLKPGLNVPKGGDIVLGSALGKQADLFSQPLHVDRDQIFDRPDPFGFIVPGAPGGFTHGGESGAGSPRCLLIACIQRPVDKAAGGLYSLPQYTTTRMTVWSHPEH